MAAAAAGPAAAAAVAVYGVPLGRRRPGWACSGLSSCALVSLSSSFQNASMQVKGRWFRSAGHNAGRETAFTENLEQNICRKWALKRITASLSSSAAPLIATFPSFLPREVEDLEEELARDLARRIQRFPVQTSFTPDPIPTGCVPPLNSGTSKLPILLLHGFDSSCLEWRHLLPMLEPLDVEAWALDIFGWGFTHAETEPVPCTVEAKREHMYEFWKTYIGRPVVVVGPSLGGAAAIDFALAHPDAVAKLVLIDAQGFTEGLGPMASLPRPFQYAGVGVLKNVMVRSYATKLAFSNTQIATEDAVRVGRLHTLMPGWEEAMVSFMRSGGYNVARRISQVQQEVLLIWGEEDTILEKSFAERFVKELPVSRLEWIANCGHLPHIEKPKKVADLLAEFLADT